MTPAPNPPPVAESVELLPCPICARPPMRTGRLGVGGVLCVGTTLDPVEHRVATYGATQAVADQSWNTRADPAIAASHEAGRIAGVREGRAEVINTPETADFMAGVPLEAAHQRERWGADHDAGKAPLDWFWLIGYLAQKAADAAMRGDADKARHHTISTAAALGNWHAALSGLSTTMRPGIEIPRALSKGEIDGE